MNEIAIKDLQYAGVAFENSLKITRAFNLKEFSNVLSSVNPQ